MLKTLIVRSLAIIVCGFLMGVGLSLINNSDDGKTTRGLASIDVEHSNLVHVSVRATKGVAAHEEQEVVLTGFLKLEEAAPSEVHFSWELPPGVTVVNGAMNGEFAMKAGDMRETHLTVIGFSAEDLKVLAFHGFVKEQNTLLGGTAAFGSRPGDNYELLAKQRSEN